MDIVQNYFRDLRVVTTTSIVFAALLFLADHFKVKTSRWENMSYFQAFIIGLFQILAFIPGASRAGVTITGARLLGFDRTSAAIFSMLLSIPIIFASLVLTSVDLMNSSLPNINDAQPFDLLGIPLIILRDKKNQIRAVKKSK